MFLRFKKSLHLRTDKKVLMNECKNIELINLAKMQNICLINISKLPLY